MNNKDFKNLINNNSYLVLFWMILIIITTTTAVTAVTGSIRMTSEYDWHTAVNAVSLSAISYCKNTTILKGNFTLNQQSTIPEKDKFPSNINDFVVTDLVRNTEHDVNGFVGYSVKEKSVFVVFRGSVSPSNWLNNFDTVMTRYPMCSG
jgi:hypothetical protein